MTKVGRFIVDPKAGAYCQITLDSGEKLIVNHDKGGFKGGRVTVEVTRLFGFGSERIGSCDLDSPVGHAALAELTKHAAEGSASATPLGALVELVSSCPSVAEVKKRWAALVSGG
jgi:hypothetical protein